MEKCDGDCFAGEGVKIFGSYKYTVRMKIAGAVFFVAEIIMNLALGCDV